MTTHDREGERVREHARRVGQPVGSDAGRGMPMQRDSARRARTPHQWQWRRSRTRALRDEVEDEVREALYGWRSGCVESAEPVWPAEPAS